MLVEILLNSLIIICLYQQTIWVYYEEKVHLKNINFMKNSFDKFLVRHIKEYYFHKNLHITHTRYILHSKI